MKKITSITFLLMFASLMMATAQDQKIIIKTTAQCGECKEKIESALNFEKGVKSAVLDVDTKELNVVYNPQKTTADKIRIAVTKAGYDADSIPADPKAYARLKPCCTKDGHKEH